MARRRKTSDPTADLARISEILERELSLQREAMDRLKQLSKTRSDRSPASAPIVRKTA